MFAWSSLVNEHDLARCAVYGHLLAWRRGRQPLALKGWEVGQLADIGWEATLGHNPGLQGPIQFRQACLRPFLGAFGTSGRRETHQNTREEYELEHESNTH